MKKKKILTVIMTFVLSFSAFTLAGCEENYTTQETDALVSQLQTTMNAKEAELNTKIEQLQQAYQAKDAELQASITANTNALATLKTEYESKAAELQARTR